ncbi:MAG: type VII toxin-antitoxin system HepT family RNase toxin [Bacillota bacterium]
MPNDILINKHQTIRRCINRINDVYDNDFQNLKDYTKQDSVILNIQRLCEATIDIAMHVIAKYDLGVPQSSRDAFEILNKEEFIDEKLTEKLKAMVGFRNLAVHEYQKINLKIVKSIIEKELDEIERFTEVIKDRVKKKENK